MTWVTISLSAATMLSMALVLTFILGWASRKFHVDVDRRALAIMETLPGANCGGCGYVGCGEYAEAVALEHEAVNKCTVGGADCSSAVAAIMAFEENSIHPTINHEKPDPEINLNVITKETDGSAVENVLSNAFGFGGMNAVVIFKRYRD